MFKIIATTALIILFGTSSAALADGHEDSVHDWSGGYVGLKVGGMIGSATRSTASGTFQSGDFNLQGALLGTLFGYNFQSDRWVLGLDSDISYSTVRGSRSTHCLGPCTTRLYYTGTTRLRIGYAHGQYLPYVTAGLATALDHEVELIGLRSELFKGFAAGAGLEMALRDGWSGRIEYMYSDFGTKRTGTNCCDFRLKNNHSLRFGISYETDRLFGMLFGQRQ